MSTKDTYLAIYLGNKSSPRMQAWAALPPAEQMAKMQAGLQAWQAWAAQHEANIVMLGGPLGKTKKISASGIEDVVNGLSGYSVVRASSHEAAAKMFEKHPHFTDFPGDSVEIMPVLPIPGA
jgi:hypothetical protein